MKSISPTGNQRLSAAISAVRILGRSADTMQELYDSITRRRERRAILRALEREHAKHLEICRGH